MSAKSIETVVENGTEVFIPPNKLKKSRKNARKPPHILARHDLLDILGNRYGRRSPIVTSQLLVDQWHALIGDPLAPTPSSTAWSITPTGSISTARVGGEPANPAARPEPVALWTCRCAWTTRIALPTSPQQEQQRTIPSSRDSGLTTRLRRCRQPDSQNASCLTPNRNGGRDQIGIPGRDHWNRHHYLRGRFQRTQAQELNMRLGMFGDGFVVVAIRDRARSAAAPAIYGHTLSLARIINHRKNGRAAPDNATFQG
jgi:hypothetical protein